MSSIQHCTGSNIDNSILHYQGSYGARIIGAGEFISDVTSETGSVYFTHHRLPIGKNVSNAFSFNRLFLSFDVPYIQNATCTAATLSLVTAQFSESAYIYQYSQNGVRHLSTGRLMSASISNEVGIDDFQTITASAGLVDGYSTSDDFFDLVSPYLRDSASDAYNNSAITFATNSEQPINIELNNNAITNITSYLLSGGTFECALIEDVYDYNFRLIYSDYSGNEQYYDNRTFGFNVYTSDATVVDNRPKLTLTYTAPAIPDSVIYITSGELNIITGSLILR